MSRRGGGDAGHAFTSGYETLSLASSRRGAEPQRSNLMFGGAPPAARTPKGGSSGGGGGGGVAFSADTQRLIQSLANEAGLSAQDAEVEEMREWKVARLREALQGRELSIKGRRPELVARLERAIRGEASSGGGSSSGGGAGGSSSRSAQGPAECSKRRWFVYWY